MMMMKPLREHLSPFSWIQPHSKGASFTSYHIPVFKCSPSMMRGWILKYSLPGRRKKGRGRGEKLERESQSPSFFPFLPILCPFRRLLLRLKYKTRLCPPFPPFPCPVFVFVLCPAGPGGCCTFRSRNREKSGIELTGRLSIAILVLHFFAKARKWCFGQEVQHWRSTPRWLGQ